jgi:anthraniloyl-CoA monooxygenase
MAMNIGVVGGGPAGLYFSILMKRAHPDCQVTVLERDGPDDTFGWGIVFSDQTFSYLAESDRPSFDRILEACETWDDVEVVHRGARVRVHGNRFSGIARLTFLQILHQRCREVGVDLRFGCDVRDLAALPSYDLLVGADGANSLVRRTYASMFRPSVSFGRNKYLWLGTHQSFDALTLTFHEAEAGAFAAHSYRFSPSTSTFIVECSEQTWRRAGFDRCRDEDTCARLARVFADDLNGHALLSNNFVRWLNFLLVRNERWYHDRVALIGDALHTAHFSIGSGTKLALEDAIALFRALEDARSIEQGLAGFEEVRKPVVDAYQEAAVESLLWFEQMQDYMALEPVSLAYTLMTRSKKIDREKLRRRDPAFVAAYEALAG